MTAREYQPHGGLATTSPTNRRELPTSEKFLRKARQLKARGQDYLVWMKAADIMWRIEHGLPVGHHRRKGVAQ